MDTPAVRLPREIMREINKAAHVAAQASEVAIRKKMVDAALQAIAQGVDWRMMVDQIGKN